ncbi:ABC transporter ATP-binding protein [Neobacillus mesonae]|nr:ABC transporter ATP-binding protein [Neobacillus mesonae]
MNAYTSQSIGRPSGKPSISIPGSRQGDFILETRGLTKRFGTFTANDRLDLCIKYGEIHAILGENGAGKSTLMNMLSGLLAPDEGELLFKGESITFASPRQAMEMGIGMVHQHFMLIPALTVAENVVLGLKEGRGPWFHFRRACAEIKKISDAFGLDVDPTKRVSELSVGQQQRVEIVKTLYRGAEFIIMDEPTAVLTPPEVKDLFVVLRSLKEQGKTIVFISHKLQEVEAVCDQVTVLRAGQMVGSMQMKETTPAELARLMVGREITSLQPAPYKRKQRSLLEVQGLSVLRNQMPVLMDIKLVVKEGEILGIAGVDGNGQRELSEALMGLTDLASGEVKLCGERVKGLHPRYMTEQGVGYIPEDRHREGLMLPMSIGENLIAKQYKLSDFSRFGMLRRGAIKKAAEQAVREFDIRTPSSEHTAGQLSGGNQQKVILARELMLNPKVLIAMQPTRGMDVGASEYVHKRLLAERERGLGILLISTELEEVLSLSDRIAVLFKGRIVDMVSREEATRERIGRRMAGMMD